MSTLSIIVSPSSLRTLVGGPRPTRFPTHRHAPLPPARHPDQTQVGQSRAAAQTRRGGTAPRPSSTLLPCPHPTAQGQDQTANTNPEAARAEATRVPPEKAGRPATAIGGLGGPPRPPRPRAGELKWRRRGHSSNTTILREVSNAQGDSQNTWPESGPTKSRPEGTTQSRKIRPTGHQVAMTYLIRNPTGQTLQETAPHPETPTRRTRTPACERHLPVLLPLICYYQLYTGIT